MFKTLMDSNEALTADSVERKETVNKLACMLIEKETTYSHMHIFNMSENFGPKKASNWMR